MPEIKHDKMETGLGIWLDENFQLVSHSSRIISLVSIWKNGQIGFNVAAVRKFKIQRANYVQLFIDKSNNKIGFRFGISDTVESGFKLTVTGKKNSRTYFSAQSVLKCLDYDYKAGKRIFYPKWNKNKGLLIIDLDFGY